MMIESICPDCETPFSADDKDIGSIYVCTECGIECIVPSLRVNPGDYFGRYRVLYPIGAGSTSEVHLGVDPDTDKQVALKILFVEDDGRMLDVKRFFREARNVASMEHDSLIRIYEMDQLQDENTYFLAMEYVEGQTLDTFLKENGALPEIDALSVVRDVATVMQHAWEEKQLIHRDIKPSNIMLTYDGRTKLMDLGIAKSLMYDVTQLTEPDTILGTPIYMSPEQCAPGKPIDHRADIYSLGATLYHLVTARYPFTGKDPLDLVRKHLFAKLKDPRAHSDELSDAGAALIMRMMEKSANKRQDSWEQLVDEVDRVILKLAQVQS